MGCSGADAGPGPSSASGAPAPDATPSASSQAPSRAPGPVTIGDLVSVEVTWAEGVDPGAAAGRSLNVPQGWTAEVWANIPGARMAAWTPDGRLAVSQADQGSVALMTPRATGAATVSALASGLSSPQGLAFATWEGTDVLVVGEDDAIVAWTYQDASITDPRAIIEGLPTSGHGAKGIAVDGNELYFSLGSSSNRDPADRTADPERAVVARIGLDGEGYEVVARGVRNGFGLALAPDGTLFTAVNQADNQPYPFRDDTGNYGQVIEAFVNENPVDQVTRVTDGADLGWPLCMPDGTTSPDLVDIGYFADPVLNPDGIALDCAALGRTQLGLPAHSAPLSIAFTTGTAAQAWLGEGALIASHGSWNRNPPREPYVVFAAWQSNDAALQQAQPVVTGFQNADGSRWGRAVAAVPGPDGAIYVTDDQAGLVYRIAPPAS